jgi:taurine dioxygenase
MAQVVSPETERDWPFEVRPLTPVFGAEIAGIDLDRAASPEVFPSIHAAWLRYQVLAFRGLEVSPAAQVAFAANFGEVQVHVMNQYLGNNDHPELYVLSNLDEDGKPSGKHPDKGTLEWHIDGSWNAHCGHSTFMYAEQPPKAGGETHFCDMYSAYDELSADWKARAEKLRAFHNLDFSRNRRHGHEPLSDAQRAAAPPVAWPVVRTHPETGRKALYLGDHAESVEGMDYDAGRALIDEMNRLITPDHLVYRHSYTPGDFVFWDNRCTMHRATLYDTAKDIRVMRRCTVLVDAPY